MAPIVVAKLSVLSPAIRNEYVTRLLAISDYARQNELGVLKYAVFIPRDEADDKTVWVIEEYSDQATFDTHMACPLVQDMIKWMTSGPVLDGAPIIHMLDWADGLEFSKPEVKTAKDLFVVFAVVGFKPGKAPDSIPYWAKVVKNGKEDEPGTLVYGILTDKEKPDNIYTFEGYESKEYLWDVHVKSEGVAETVKNTKEWRTGLEHNLLKMKGGFLHR